MRDQLLDSSAARAAIYTRISHDRDGRSEAPDRQEADCRTIAAQRGWTVAEVYTDRDVSAFKQGSSRPAYDRMVADLRAGRIDVVIVWKLDRLSRQGLTFLGRLISDLEQSRAQLVSATEPLLDTSSGVGEAILGVIAGIAKQESQNAGLRISRVLRERAKRGLMMGGCHRPFGLRQQFTLHPIVVCLAALTGHALDPALKVMCPDGDGPAGSIVAAEAAIVRELYERVLAGASLNSLTVDLNRRGIATSGRKKPIPTADPNGELTGEQNVEPRSGRWVVTTVKVLLRSPRLAGLRWVDGDWIHGQWEPILTAEEFFTLQKTLDASRWAHPNRPRGPFSGLLYCGRCGCRLYAQQRTNRGRPYDRYVCFKDRPHPGCGNTSVTKPTLDNYLVDQLLDFLARAHPLATDASDDASLVQLIEADSVALSELVVARYVRRELREEDFTAARVALEERLAHNQAVLNARRLKRTRRQRQDLHLGDRAALATWWSDATTRERIAAARQAIARVVILPRTASYGPFDPTRVAIEWNTDLYLTS